MNPQKKIINLDYAAATPVSKTALSRMLPYFSDNYYNPSAPYMPAKLVRDEYENAKASLAQTIGAKKADIIICSGATESINLAFTLIKPEKSGEGPLALILSTEHPSVRATASQFSHEEIGVDKTGMINIDELKSKLSDSVQLISISLANNELGTIQPLSDIAEIIKKTRFDRYQRGITTPLFLHTDASQALTLIDVSVARLGVDLLTMNSAKLYGPKGIGALYATPDAMSLLRPIILGGGQENNLRSGTENVPLLIGFSAAAVEAKEHIAGSRKKFAKLAEIFRNELCTNNIIPQFLGNANQSLCNFIPLSFPGLDAERIIYKLESEGILVSTGAACAARKGEKSHTLMAIGLSDDEIAGSLRVTLGGDNTEEDVLFAAKCIKNAVNEEYARIHG